jgi:predicted transport protein
MYETLDIIETGDLEIVISTDKDLEKVKLLINMSFDKN